MKGCSHTVAWCFHTKGDWNGFVGMEMRVFGICIELGNIYTGIDCEVICAKKVHVPCEASSSRLCPR